MIGDRMGMLLYRRREAEKKKAEKVASTAKEEKATKDTKKSDK